MRADTINFVHMPPIRPGRIILLNGTSSSGKTSIAEQLLLMLNPPYFHMSVDAINSMRAEAKRWRGQLAARAPRAARRHDAVLRPPGTSTQRHLGATSRVSQQIDPIPPEMRAQRLDIVDQPITSVTRRVRRYGRFPGPAQVKQHQRAALCQRRNRQAGRAEWRHDGWS